MWRVETDYFALAVFVIMLIKEHSQRKEHNDIQNNAFYFVLIVSILNVIIDIFSSLAMNRGMHWWPYQILMTVYVASMPLLALIWTCYAYVLIHKDYSVKRLNRDLLVVLIPYLIYVLVALSNPFTELFFHLSPQMEYSRGILFMPVGVGSIMVYSAVGLLLVLYNFQKIYPRVNAFLLMAFFLVTSCVIWIQLANPGWLVINASYAVIYVWCDITVEEQRRRELYSEINHKNEELEIVARKAESAAQAKSEFLSRMSHDIRTPMNAIIGLTHLAQEEDNIQVVREYLYNIETSSDFLLGLINDILDMSKIENGELKLKEDVYRKEEFVNSINTVIKPLMDKRDIHFVFEMGAHVDCIRVDRLRYNQIFFNLLSNAAKFTPKGGIVEFLSESIPPKEDKVGIRFRVRDNGIGMSPEFLPHMYDPFSQERSEMGDEVKGTGLGLPIVKSLVDIMGGTISVKSELGKGTEFTVDLYVPLAEPESEELSTDTMNENLMDARILLVEDNEINIYVAQLILEKAGCVVEIAKNGREAVEVFNASEENHFDAILMDVRMPVMNGIDATRKIRALERPDAAKVPIIAMTADAFEEERKKTLEAGMNYHLSKPINPKLLYRILSSHLTDKGTEA